MVYIPILHHYVDTLSLPITDERTSCEEGDVSLRDGTDPSNGRVEICQHRTWGAVCSDEWDDNAVRVVCGQLFYNPEGKYWYMTVHQFH